jgi:hypothetical protein
VYQHLAGVAEVRGDRWAERIAFHHPRLLVRPWPDTDRMRTIASRQVVDLANPAFDPVLHAQFVERAITGARRRWDELRANPKRARQMKPAPTRRK